MESQDPVIRGIFALQQMCAFVVYANDVCALLNSGDCLLPVCMACAGAETCQFLIFGVDIVHHFGTFLHRNEFCDGLSAKFGT